MHAIILVAGMGKRLRPLTLSIPKSMIKIGNKPLLEYYFQAFRECGINEATLVIGHLGRMIKEKFRDTYEGIKIKYIYNDKYQLYGSAFSLWLARKAFFKESFLVMDGDVLFHKNILKKLIDSKYENCLVVDSEFIDTGEEVKVIAEGQVVKALGKKVSVYGDNLRCVGEAVGFYKFSKKVSKKIAEGLKRFMNVYGYTSDYEDVLNYLLSPLTIYYTTTCGLPWIEIDFLSDLKKAKLEIYPRIL